MILLPTETAAQSNDNSMIDAVGGATNRLESLSLSPRNQETTQNTAETTHLLSKDGDKRNAITVFNMFDPKDVVVSLGNLQNHQDSAEHDKSIELGAVSDANGPGLLNKQCTARFMASDVDVKGGDSEHLLLLEAAVKEDDAFDAESVNLVAS